MKKKKKVLIIATYFPPSGGVGVFRITKFIKYLQKYDYDISVVTTSEKYIFNEDKSLLKNIKPNTKIYRLDFPCKKESQISIKFYFSLRKNIDKIIKETNPDVVLITGGPFYIIPIGRYIKKHYGIPYIIDLRDPWASQIKTNKNIKAYIRSTLDNLLEYYTFKEASSIITINDTMTEELIKKYIKLKNKISTISNGYDPDDFKDIKPKKLDKFTILYTGKFTVSAGYRNPKNLFKAIYNLTNKGLNIEFVHIGTIEKKIVELSKAEKIYQNCRFLGFLTVTEIYKYCKGSDILVVISGKEKSEQTGKIFEYIGCNIPVLAITNKQNELYKVCKKSKLIFQVNNNSSKQIENIIDKIYNKTIKIEKEFEIKELTREYLTLQLIKIIENIND